MLIRGYEGTKLTDFSDYHISKKYQNIGRNISYSFHKYIGHIYIYKFLVFLYINYITSY